MGTLERDVAACFMVTIPGARVTADAARWLGEGLGAVIIFGANVVNPSQLRDFTAQVHALSPEALIAVDEEGGDVTRLEHQAGSSSPGNLALGTVDDVELTRTVAGSIADRIVDAGINLDLAPDADVNTEAGNPVIGARSFGADPALVARHVAAAVEGLQSRRVAACAKHFPGHGATSTDSHLQLPIVTRPDAGLRSIDLVPFRAAIASGVQAVMTAHVVYPAWDDRPATVSRRILTDLLRGELGFDGVVATDALRMAAISEGIGVAEGAVAALAAGADLLCVDVGYAEQRATRAAVIDAVVAGRLSGDRVEQAADRVRRLQAWAHPVRPAESPANDIGREAARRALLIDLGPDAPALPLTRAPYVIDAGSRVRSGVDAVSGSLLAELRPAEGGVNGRAVEGRRVEGVVLTEQPADVAAIIAAAAGRPLIVAVREAHRSGWREQLVRASLHARPDAIVVGTGTPHDAAYAPGRYVGALGVGRANLQAVADLLLGDFPP